jgi:hypothetical protein
MPSVDTAAVADMIQDMEREDDARRGMAVANALNQPTTAVQAPAQSNALGMAISGTGMRTTNPDVARNMEQLAVEAGQRDALTTAGPQATVGTAVQASGPAPSTAGFHQTMAQYGVSDQTQDVGEIGETGQSGVSVGYADSEAEDAAYGRELGISGSTPPGREAAIHQASLDALESYRNSLEPKDWNLTTLSELNLNALVNDPEYGNRTVEENEALFSRPISEYGTGIFSPAAMLAGQGATAQQTYDVNRRSASGGYGINDPASDVSVPAGYNMGFFPAAMASLTGSMSPLAGLMTAGYPGLMSWAGDSLEDDPGPLGSALRGVRGIGNQVSTGVTNAFSPVTNAFGDLTGTVRDGVVDFGGGLGDALSNFDSPFPDFGPPTPEVDTMGQSAADPGPDNEFASLPNMPDDSFSVTDGVVQNPGEKEKEYSPIPPDILARILANVQYGRERQRIAREMG